MKPELHIQINHQPSKKKENHKAMKKQQVEITNNLKLMSSALFTVEPFVLFVKVYAQCDPFSSVKSGCTRPERHIICRKLDLMESHSQT